MTAIGDDRCGVEVFADFAAKSSVESTDEREFRGLPVGGVAYEVKFSHIYISDSGAEGGGCNRYNGERQYNATDANRG